MSTTPDPDQLLASAGLPTSQERRIAQAEADGRGMGRALRARSVEERAAWWRGAMTELGEDPRREKMPCGLVPAPAGWAWAEAGGHVLDGSSGLAHLVREPYAGNGRDARVAPAPLPVEDGVLARCELRASVWWTIPRLDPAPREACPTCAGGVTMS